MTENDEPPTTNQPLHGRPRPKYWPLLAVAGLILVLLAVFMLLTWLQKNT